MHLESAFRVTPKVASRVAADFRQALSEVPEVAGACEWMRANPDEFSEVISGYTRVNAKLDKYSDDDIKRIQGAENLLAARRASSTSASRLRTIDFLRTRANPHELFGNTAIQAFNPSSSFYPSAMTQLAEMMLAGHRLFANGETPQDGDPASDKVIWGHTQAKADVQPDILAHFIVGHHLGRYFAAAFSASGESRLAANKDAYLAVLTSVILFEESLKTGATGRILDVWMTSRADGGLGWISRQQLDAYSEACS